MRRISIAETKELLMTRMILFEHTLKVATNEVLKQNLAVSNKDYINFNIAVTGEKE